VKHLVTYQETDRRDGATLLHTDTIHGDLEEWWDEFRQDQLIRFNKRITLLMVHQL
jgi:hypothetical protein